MKLSMMTYTMMRVPDFTIEGTLDLMLELEMDGIDICFAGRMGKSAKELRQMLDGSGIRAVCNTFSNDINEPGMTESGWLDRLKMELENAVILGAPAVLIPTPGKPQFRRSENRKNWIAVLSKGVELAGKAGIYLTVENFPGDTSPFVVASDMLEAVGQVPGLKITYDNGNAAGGEDPAESFRLCSGHVVHAHFKDWDISDMPKDGYMKMLDGKYYRPALIGEGDIYHRACIRAMLGCGYDGYINIEYEGNKYSPHEGVRKAAAYLRAIIEEEQQA